MPWLVKLEKWIDAHVQTLLPKETAATTVDISVRYLRPITVRTGIRSA